MKFFILLFLLISTDNLLSQEKVYAISNSPDAEIININTLENNIFFQKNNVFDVLKILSVKDSIPQLSITGQSPKGWVKREDIDSLMKMINDTSMAYLFGIESREYEIISLQEFEKNIEDLNLISATGAQLGAYAALFVKSYKEHSFVDFSDIETPEVDPALNSYLKNWWDREKTTERVVCYMLEDNDRLDPDDEDYSDYVNLLYTKTPFEFLKEIPREYDFDRNTNYYFSYDWIKDEHIDSLFILVDSKETCYGMWTAKSSQTYKTPTTLGEYALDLINFYRRGQTYFIFTVKLPPNYDYPFPMQHKEILLEWWEIEKTKKANNGKLPFYENSVFELLEEMSMENENDKRFKFESHRYPIDWLNEADIKALIPLLHSDKQYKYFLSPYSKNFLNGKATLGGLVAQIIKSYKNRTRFIPNVFKIPEKDEKLIQELESWWEKKKKK